MKWSITRCFHLPQRDASLALLLSGIVILFFLPALVQPNALIWPHSGLGSDISYQHWPNLIEYATSWRHGAIALWNPTMALGHPNPGDANVLFLYPFDLLFGGLPTAVGVNAFLAAHVWLAGLGMLLLLRKGFYLTAPAALLGAIAFAFTPKFMAHLAGGHLGLIAGLAWVPFAFLGLKLALRGNLLAAAFGGFALALQMPTHGQIPYFTILFGSAYWIWRLAAAGWARYYRRQFSEFNFAKLFGGYLLWVGSFSMFAAAFILPLLELLPYNSRAVFALQDANKYSLPPSLLLTLLAPGKFQFPEWTMFLGALPPLLAFPGIRYSRKPEKWYYVMWTAFALVFSLGLSTPLLGLAYSVIPGLQLVRVPTRLWFFGGFAVAILTGFGVDGLTQDMRGKLRNHSVRGSRLVGLYFAGGIAALVGYRLFLGSWHGLLALQLLTVAITVGIVWAWLLGALTDRRVQWLLLPVLLLDLLPLAASYIDLADPSVKFLDTTPALEYVAQQDGLFRVYSPGGERDWSYAVGVAHGLESLEGLLGFQIGHAVEKIRSATGCPITGYATEIPPCLPKPEVETTPDAKRLGELNVRFWVSSEPLPRSIQGDFVLAFDGSPAVYENRFWQPRARLTPPGIVQIRNLRAGVYEMEVLVLQEDLLVVSDTWLPGWRATVDGVPVNVERVEEALLGVPLESGDHVVRLWYEPAGWQVGWRLSVLSIIGLLVWTLTAVMRRRRFLR